MADTQSILQLGIEAARSGDKAEARELFRLVTREDPNSSQGWLWLAGVAEDRDEKRVALERVLQLDPSNELARKGLAALGGAGAAGAGAAAAASTTAPTPPTSTPSAPPPSAGAQTTAFPVADQNMDDTFAAADNSAPAPGRGRARIYEQPEQVGGYVPADFGDDDYDLAEYQNRPEDAVDDPADRDRVVVVEDEEPRRRGFGAWIPALVILLLFLGVLGYLLYRSFGDNNDGNVANDPNASAVSGGVAGDPSADPSAGADASVAADVNTESALPSASSDATALLTSPSAEGAPEASVASDAEASVEPSPAGDATAPSAAPSSDAAAASPATDAGAASAPTDAGVASPEASAAVVAPPDDAAATPPADAAASPPPAAPAPIDVATANPAIVGNDQVLRAGNFEYSFTGLANVASGSYGGSPPARGRYLIVLMTVRNVGDTPAQIPDGFFVVKDAQGRVSDFNRAASVDYINRFGGTGPRGAGDYAADAQLPPGALMGSMPLLFDVAADATDLVVFSRDNTAQGFLVRQNAR